MRTLLIAAAALACTATTASADLLEGYWRSAEGRDGGCAIVEFRAVDFKYNGEIIAIIDNEVTDSVGTFMFTDLRKKSPKPGALETYGGGKAYAPDEPEKSYPFGHAHITDENTAFMGAGNCGNRMEVVDESSCRIGVFTRTTPDATSCS